MRVQRERRRGDGSQFGRRLTLVVVVVAVFLVVVVVLTKSMFT